MPTVQTYNIVKEKKNLILNLSTGECQLYRLTTLLKKKKFNLESKYWRMPTVQTYHIVKEKTI